MALKKARVLRELQIDGQSFKPSEVIVAEEKLLKSYAEDGSVDLDAGAVEYCEKELGAKPKQLGKSAKAEAPAA